MLTIIQSVKVYINEEKKRKLAVTEWVCVVLTSSNIFYVNKEWIRYSAFVIQSRIYLIKSVVY